MRYFIEFAYNGKNYCGWQYQPHSPSVQETLNKALSTLLRTQIEVVGAGRTDTGVHARQMFAHFDYGEVIDSDSLTQKLNSFCRRISSCTGLSRYMMMPMQGLML
ncbi:hypothetical protein [Flavobacterium sp. J372]|uniref:hypothetical protein n=1 Tax=Flavobacterium sp. J372 TaxID=2898436 RepID=UPI0035B547D6